ncbi:hypothetical protein L873DRAFT_1731992 [Choiromyces venosus 120613-1]|uniref:Acyl-CoA dehydrogenase/oxidase C-terminal n=1 Tax=Choiromyces venosus 120613-1 TaxID=1336337 RepID=A0A3N4KAW2_9PEZI|nr:hypothetical protein L873DRAFT_1731992 [Choiromyces venosus 120613-1]
MSNSGKKSTFTGSPQNQHPSQHNQQQHPHQQQQQPNLRPSSGDAGFFQDPPRLGNQFEEDVGLKRVLSLYLPPALLKPLHKELGLLAVAALSPQVLHWVEDAEAHPPTLESHDAFANRSDNLRTSEGWRRLAELGAHQGIVAEGYEGRYGRIGQFAKYYIFSPSSALTTCPFAMTDGAARLLSQHIPHPATSIQSFFSLNSSLSSRREAEIKRQVFYNAHFRLISRDQSARWTSGQWMTERPGGSDVSKSETVAVYSPLAPSSQMEDGTEELGPWVVDGYKFFSSATDADMTILLARTPGGGGKLSAFYAPMKLASGERNGVRIVRLKRKLGTRALPTAELELKGMRAWMIGEEGEGIKQIATVLNITRVHNAVSAISFMRRGLAIAKAYSKVRIVAKNRPLWTIPLHLRTLAHLELYQRATTHLTFFTIHLLSLSESSTTPSLPSPNASSPLHTPSTPHQLLRLLTPITKALTAKLAMSTLSECAESLGGVGYCENEEPLNIARLLRDAQVLSIWEGTTNVLITDLISSLKRTSRAGGEEQGWVPFNEFVEENLGSPATATTSRVGEVEAEVLERCKVALWEEWKEFEKILETRSKEELTAGGRVVLWTLGWVLCGVLLIIDARRDGERTAVEFARRWVLEKAGIWGALGEYGVLEGEVEKRARADCWAVFGEKLPEVKDRARL